MRSPRARQGNRCRPDGGCAMGTDALTAGRQPPEPPRSHRPGCPATACRVPARAARGDGKPEPAAILPPRHARPFRGPQRRPRQPIQNPPPVPPSQPCTTEASRRPVKSALPGAGGALNRAHGQLTKGDHRVQRPDRQIFRQPVADR
jgi:hypothetical protein